MRNKYCASQKQTLRDAMNQMDKEGVGVLFVLNDNEIMVGMLTDGDVRRAILRGISLAAPIFEIMNSSFVYGEEGQSKVSLLNLMRKIHRRHLPILDKDKRVKNIILLDEIEFRRNHNLVVLMVGGFGTRLGSLTKTCPKPMLEVGEKPILENIITAFSDYGFYNFVLSVNYLSNVIEEYFGDGSNWGVEIQYLHEEEPLGTVGALRLLKKIPNEAFFVMNGDLLTRLNFHNLLEYHKDHNVMATMTVIQHESKVPYGVVEHEGCYIKSIQEKPIQKHYVNAGIYILEPSCLNFIPPSGMFDMTDLIGNLISQKHKVAMFPIHEYWRDIGLIEELRLANEEFCKIKK